MYLQRALVVVALCVCATEARADPCDAIPERGPLPTYLTSGSSFAGPVVYVGDGDSLCVAVGDGPRSWVEVRLADFYAPELQGPGGAEAKRALERIAMGKRATCIAYQRSYDRIVASCTVGGRSVGERMTMEGIREGGNGRR